MAGGRPPADEKLEDGFSSPTTAYTSDLGESTLNECGAVIGDSASEQRWCGLFTVLSHLSRTWSSSGTWRARLRLKDPERVPDVEQTITRQLESCPEGYPRLAAFLSSENSFSIYRGFGYLHSRVLLGLQDHIVSLERELDQKDSFDQNNGLTRRLQSRARDERESHQDGEERPRDQILDDIRRKLVEYDEILVKARNLVSFQKASERDYRSVSNWICNLKPLVDKEQCFIKHKEDLLTLHNGREWSGFDGLIESMLLKLDCKLVRQIFLTPEMRVKTTDRNVHYYARSRVDVFVTLVITTIIFILLVLPVVAMYRLTTFGTSSGSTFKAIGVLVVFTLLFSAAMSLLTKARRHELFGASAAYCAVLVVFISNFSNTQ
ncbi:hypothetical protein GJ744_005273 [Endocarpon pusillum]|uniref:DUF6594 domain-containing protein n=1 Tax=Endocarpon pusillum TaxID=364733 RepID=A0A8H7ACE4_9EURO|nr:hypothetical protein GJ744_005273 [Endocarpon pusillum]